MNFKGCRRVAFGFVFSVFVLLCQANLVILFHISVSAGLSSTQPIVLPAIHGMNLQMTAQGPYQRQYPDQYRQEEQSQDRDEYNDSRGKGSVNSARQSSQDDRVHELRKEKSSEDESFQESSFGKETRVMSEDSDPESIERGMNSKRDTGLSQRLRESSQPTKVHTEQQQQQKQKSQKSKMHKKSSSDSSGSNQPEPRTVKFIQPELVQSLPITGPNGLFISPPTPIPSGRVIASPRPQQKADRDSDRSKQSDGSGEKQRSQGNKLASNKNNPVESQNKKQGSKAQKAVSKKKQRRSRSPSVEKEQTLNENVFGDGEVGVESKDRIKWEIADFVDVEERSKFVQFPSPDKDNRKPLMYENEVDSGIAEDGPTPP